MYGGLSQGKRMDCDPPYREHEGSRVIRVGKWKAVAINATCRWELHDIHADRLERVKYRAPQWEPQYAGD